MHRIDAPDATSDHRFTEGDPTIPVPATTVTADWLNAVQEELVTVLAAAKIDVSKADNSQLLAALRLLTVAPGDIVPPDGVTIDAINDALTVLAAPKLQTPRTIVLYGGATGAASFDGSADARIDVTSLDLGKGTGTLPVSKGGTGATTADAARQNLGIVLNNTVTSSSAVEFATAGAVKTAYDKALAAGVTLNNTVTSTSTTEAATANAVKTAYDKALAAANAVGSGVVALEAYRQSRIGTPHHLSSTTLPAGYMWADGSLASFSDWPELAAKFAANGFAGMLLPWNSSSSSKSSYPAMWVPNAANPSGLYLPRLGGLFSRNWTPGQGSAGAYNAPGVPNIYGRLGANRLGIYEEANNQCTGPFSRYLNNLANGQLGADSSSFIANYFMFNASYSSSLYGASSTVMPPSANVPVAVYLGVHA